MSKNRYSRKQGNRESQSNRPREITFSWSKLDLTQGQSVKTWEKEGILSKFIERTKQIGQHSAQEALAKELIKQYTKHEFPPKSEFIQPKHITPPEYWAVIHLTPNSKEVVVGYIEDDIFYIVFLDKEHKFWPMDIQDKGKKK